MANSVDRPNPSNLISSQPITISSSEWRTPRLLGGKERTVVKYAIQNNAIKVTVEKCSISFWDRVFSFFFKNYKVTEKFLIEKQESCSSIDDIKAKFKDASIVTSISKIFNQAFPVITSRAEKPSIITPAITEPTPTVASAPIVSAPELPIIETITLPAAPQETSLPAYPKVERAVKKAVKVQTATRSVWAKIALVGSIVAAAIVALRQGGTVPNTGSTPPVTTVVPYFTPPAFKVPSTSSSEETQTASSIPEVIPELVEVKGNSSAPISSEEHNETGPIPLFNRTFVPFDMSAMSRLSTSLNSTQQSDTQMDLTCRIDEYIRRTNPSANTNPTDEIPSDIPHSTKTQGGNGILWNLGLSVPFLYLTSIFARDILKPKLYYKSLLEKLFKKREELNELLAEKKSRLENFQKASRIGESIAATGIETDVSQLAKVRAQEQAHLERIAQLNERIATLSNAESDLDTLIAAKKIETDAVLQRLANVNNQGRAQIQKEEDHRKQIALLDEKIATLLNANKDLDQQIAAKKPRQDQLIAQLALENQKKEGLEKELNEQTAQTEIDGLKLRIDTVFDRINNFHHEIGDINSFIAKIERQKIANNQKITDLNWQKEQIHLKFKNDNNIPSHALSNASKIESLNNEINTLLVNIANNEEQIRKIVTGVRYYPIVGNLPAFTLMETVSFDITIAANDRPKFPASSSAVTSEIKRAAVPAEIEIKGTPAESLEYFITKQAEAYTSLPLHSNLEHVKVLPLSLRNTTYKPLRLLGDQLDQPILPDLWLRKDGRPENFTLADKTPVANLMNRPDFLIPIPLFSESLMLHIPAQLIRDAVNKCSSNTPPYYLDLIVNEQKIRIEVTEENLQNLDVLEKYNYPSQRSAITSLNFDSPRFLGPTEINKLLANVAVGDPVNIASLDLGSDPHVNEVLKILKNNRFISCQRYEAANLYQDVQEDVPIQPKRLRFVLLDRSSREFILDAPKAQKISLLVKPDLNYAILLVQRKIEQNLLTPEEGSRAVRIDERPLHHLFYLRLEGANTANPPQIKENGDGTINIKWEKQ